MFNKMSTPTYRHKFKEICWKNYEINCHRQWDNDRLHIQNSTGFICCKSISIYKVELQRKKKCKRKSSTDEKLTHYICICIGIKKKVFHCFCFFWLVEFLNGFISLFQIIAKNNRFGMYQIRRLKYIFA